MLLFVFFAMVNQRGGKKGHGCPRKDALSPLKESPLISFGSDLHSCEEGLVHEQVCNGVVLKDPPIHSPDLVLDLQLHDGLDLLMEIDEGKLDWATLSALDKEDNSYGFVPSSAKNSMRVKGHDLVGQSNANHVLSSLEVLESNSEVSNATSALPGEIRHIDVGLGASVQASPATGPTAKPD